MKKTFFISIAFLLAVFFGLDYYWKNWLQQQTNEKQLWVLNKERENFDIAFLGSSRVYTGMNTKIVDEITGKKSINLGCDGASIMENYVLLTQFFKADNNINELYLQVDNSALIDMNKAYSYPFHDYLFLDRLNDPDVSEAMSRTKGSAKCFFWKYIPYIKYAEFNNFYSLKEFFPFFRKPKVFAFDEESGSNLIDKEMPAELRNKKNEGKVEDSFECSNESLLYLEKIIRICEEKGIKCTLYKAPIYKYQYDRYRSSGLSENFIQQFSQKKAIRFIDFQNTQISDSAICFKDYSHLSKVGANLFSAIMCDSIDNVNYSGKK